MKRLVLALAAALWLLFAMWTGAQAVPGEQADYFQRVAGRV